jgi:hypothetical protein
MQALPKRIVRDLYLKFGWSTTKEKKWADMGTAARSEFAKAASNMRDRYPEISLHAIVVKKENVGEHIRKDDNKLYNYMMGLSLLIRMAEHDDVSLVPDPRSIKVQSGNSLHDYLQLELWFSKNVKTKLRHKPIDSKHCQGLQFADMLAGLIQSRFEDNAVADFGTLAPKIQLKRLFFGN